LPSADHLLDGLNSFLARSATAHPDPAKARTATGPRFEKRWPEVLGSFLEDQPKRP
jgi:hypothetical protein